MPDTDIDAVKLLTAQHRDMEQRLEQVANAPDDAEKRSLFAQTANLLTMHIKSEEEIFYPAVHQARTEDELLEALEEHLSLKRLLADLIELEPPEKAFEAKFKVLREQTVHHHHEEEAHLFPAVLALLDAQQRAVLGKELLARQGELALLNQPRRMVASETGAAAPLR